MYINNYFLALCFCALCSFFTKAQERQTFVVGAQNINYFPHYDFDSQHDKGFAWAVLNAFSEQSNYHFVFEGLPIKRLQKELQKGTVDFAYPDNPKWQIQIDSAQKKYFSMPFVSVLGGTMVKPERLGLSLARFDSLSVPFGFTPLMWMDLIRQKKVKTVSVNDAFAALQMVIKDRTHGADIEYHVAHYILDLLNQPESLVFDPSLPYDIVSFQLTTIKHPELLRELDAFLLSNNVLIKTLRTQYRLKSPQQILQKRNK